MLKVISYATCSKASRILGSTYLDYPTLKLHGIVIRSRKMQAKKSAKTKKTSSITNNSHNHPLYKQLAAKQNDLVFQDHIHQPLKLLKSSPNHIYVPQINWIMQNWASNISDWAKIAPSSTKKCLELKELDLVTLHWSYDLNHTVNHLLWSAINYWQYCLWHWSPPTTLGLHWNIRTESSPLWPPLSPTLLELCWKSSDLWWSWQPPKCHWLLSADHHLLWPQRQNLVGCGLVWLTNALVFL